MPTKTKNRNRNRTGTILPVKKNNKGKLNCYRFNNPYYDVLIYNLKKGINVSERQKNVMRSLIKEQKEKGNNCFKAADSNEIFYFSSLKKYLGINRN